jgi:glucose dehydrogenase
MKLNKRGKRVRALLILAGVVFLVWVAGFVWWTPTGGCIGTMTECVGL